MRVECLGLLKYLKVGVIVVEGVAISVGDVPFLGFRIVMVMLNVVQLLIDEDVLNSEFVGCHPCINTSSLRLRTKDLIEKILPAVEHDFIRVKL